MKEQVFPLQPIVDHRFVENRIVRKLLDDGHFDMNDIAMWDVSKEDHVQFAQLIGYSLSGFADLSYVDDESYEAASKVAETGVTELEARNEILRETLDEAREGVKTAAAALFRVHTDDLHT